MSHFEKHVFICCNQKAEGKKCCADKASEVFFNYLKTRLLELNMHGPGKIRVSKSGCLGRCSVGPCMVIYPEARWYSYESFADIDELIETELQQSKPLPRLALDS